MNEIYFYIYIFVTFLIAIYLTLRNNPAHKYITFIIAYWLLAGSVLNTEYFIIDIKRLPFDLHPRRVIFILFSIDLILVWVGGHKDKKNKLQGPKFERYLVLYVFLSIIVTLIHTMGIVGVKEAIVSATSIFAFLVIYLVLKRTSDRGMIRVFFKALLIVCTISSLIGICQFLFDPLFFRLGSERQAFSSFLRSNGVYHAEYIQSYFLLPGIILALFTIRTNLLKYTLIVLFLLGVILTFHRMSWIITILLFALYLIEVKKKNVWQMITVGIAVALVFLFSAMFFPRLTEIERSSFVQDRFLADTMTERMSFYGLIFKNFSTSWLIGFGSGRSNVYYKIMSEAGMDEEWCRAERGGIHNLYLAIMFFKGVPVLIVFLMFIVYFIDHHHKKTEIHSLLYCSFIENVT